MASILKNWVADLGLRHQGVLLTSVRGCDTAAKLSSVKDLVRVYRDEILVAHCGDSLKSKSFIENVDNDELHQRMLEVLNNNDHLPHHYLMHLIHSAEILGYKHPDLERRAWWNWFYNSFCKKLHMNIESEYELDKRLNADEETFFKQQ